MSLKSLFVIFPKNPQNRELLNISLMVLPEMTRVLPNVLEKGRRQKRQAKFNTENNQKHAGEAAPDAHLDKLAGIGDDGRIEQDW